MSGILIFASLALIPWGSWLRSTSPLPGTPRFVLVEEIRFKIVSKLVRTFTDRHGLKDLCRDLLGVDISKQQQSSDWGAHELSPEQQTYAATDVLHLHAIKEILDERLIRERRGELAQACFDFLPHRARLDLAGWDEVDIFHH